MALVGHAAALKPGLRADEEDDRVLQVCLPMRRLRAAGRPAPPPPTHWRDGLGTAHPAARATDEASVISTATPGGFLARCAAHLIDHAVVGIPLCVLVSLAILHDLGESDVYGMATGDVLVFLLPRLLLYGGAAVLAWGVYEVGMTSSAWGATIGKRVLAIKIVQADGRAPGLGRAAGRFLAKALVSPLLPLCSGYLMALFGRDKRALHDIVAGTVVVRADLPLRPSSPPGAANDAAPTLTRAAVLAAMGRGATG